MSDIEARIVEAAQRAVQDEWDRRHPDGSYWTHGVPARIEASWSLGKWHVCIPVRPSRLPNRFRYGSGATLDAALGQLAKEVGVR